MIPLTQQAHEKLAPFIKPGDSVIDATCGNGFDTVFLAKTVGPNGNVFAFDIQQAAIDNTIERLKQEQCLRRVKLIHKGHQHLLDEIPAPFHGKISTIMFNLGYLPGSDKSIITQTDNTISALQQSIKLLKENGILSVMLYPNHEGGAAEAEAVRQWSLQPGKQWNIETLTTKGPELLLIKRL